jgi:TPR repeat protein
MKEPNTYKIIIASLLLVNSVNCSQYKSKSSHTKQKEKIMTTDKENEIFEKAQNGLLSKTQIADLVKAAESGDAKYQCALALMYLYQTCTAGTPEEGAKWLKKSAKNGYAYAQRLLGIAYAMGAPYFKQDYKEAIKWYLKAADQGDPYAICNLGLMIENGQGCDRDLKAAVDHYKIAADAGLSHAQHLLADMYYAGRGIEQNHQKAYDLYKRASEHWESEDNGSDLDPFFRIGRCYAEYKVGSLDEAVKAFKKSFERGNTEALTYYVLMYFFRDRETMSEEDGEWLLQKASSNPSDPNCLFVMGVCYEMGFGTKQDYKKSFKSYEKAALLGHAFGQHHLAYMYFQGWGVEKNPEIGFQWELKAAERIPMAKFNVGISYLNGEGVEQNIEEAIKWLKKASDVGYTAADDALAQISNSTRMGNKKITFWEKIKMFLARNEKSTTTV